MGTTVPTRRGGPTQPLEPLPPHVPVTGERQWRLVNPSGIVTIEVFARDHRWKLVNGASARPLYLLLGQGPTHLELTPEPPAPTPGGVGWATELQPTSTGTAGSGDPIRYGQSLCLRASATYRPQAPLSGDVTTLLAGGASIGDIADRGATHTLELSPRTRRPEWQIKGGRSDGETLHVGEWFALYNTRIGDFVVLAPGGWGSGGASPGLQTLRRSTAPPLTSHTFTLGLQANVPYQGVICWYGRFPLMGGATPGSYLTGIGVPPRSTPIVLDFWCPARRRWDVRVPAGSTMSSAQLKDVFGSATPALPVQMWVVVEAPGSIGTGPLIVNLEYVG